MKKSYIMCLIITLSINILVYAEEFMSEAMDSWVGYSIDDVIRSLGYPDDEKNIANKHLYYWYNSSSTYVPPNTTSIVTPSLYTTRVSSVTSGGYTVNKYCNKIFEVDKDNRVVSWQYKGNSCPNFYFTGKSLVNPNNDKWEKIKQSKKDAKLERKKLKELQTENR